MMFAPLFSGSSGNCVYVGFGETRLLVDAGVSGSRILQELGRIGVAPDSLDAILVTHEHADHIQSVGILSRKLNLPVYATEGTWAGMEAKVGDVSLRNRREIASSEDFYLGDINVTAFALPHDANQPTGYAFEARGARFCVATDIGCVKEGWLKAVAGAQAVLLESNYDPGMLDAGRYPYALKHRIASKRGHLANEDAGEAAAELIRRGARRVVLGHLSKENNFPELALTTCRAALTAAGIDPEKDVAVGVARRDGLTGLYALGDE